MQHDPLCQYRPDVAVDYGVWEKGQPCRCDFIARVRADERKRHMVRAPEYGSGSWSSGSMTSGTQVTWQ